MKKNVLALSIAAALVGFGFACASTAGQVAPSAATITQIDQVSSVNNTMINKAEVAGITKMTTQSTLSTQVALPSGDGNVSPGAVTAQNGNNGVDEGQVSTDT